MKKALEYIVTSIVDNKEEVKIEEADQNGALELTITVASEDMGKVIGKNGKVIKAIRNVIKIPAIKQGKKIFVNLAENPQNQA